MQKTLQNHHTPISIGGIHMSNLRFADAIDLISAISSKLNDLSNRLFERALGYVM
ncbi:hypothetical protein DPMN_160693 [Dreissena polymorpha]|uniref:Uncharacterized protein n=1 Tax=Dreissena polymorpha TaxID=45954 RepID=A0A9D4ENZ4_DREPO|nr:hypothetical protein DPMN_160693 [Dreissena polymorpha]